jgi:hypothetical protein
LREPVPFAFATGSAAIDTEQELTKIKRHWAAARRKGDVAFLEKLYAKELLITGADGMLVERDTDIGLFARKEGKPQSIEDDDLKVSVQCPDVAMMTGRETPEGTWKGRVHSGVEGTKTASILPRLFPF